MTTSNDNVQQPETEPDAIGDGIYTGTLVGCITGVVTFLVLGWRGLFPAPVSAVLDRVPLSMSVSIAMITGIAWGVTSIVLGLRRERQTEGGDQ